MLFRGITELNLDAKGRLAIPLRYRAALQERDAGSLVITIDIAESCLAIYPLHEWAIIEQQLDALPGLHATVTRIKRMLMGNATDVAPDSHGRILIPAKLRQYAQLEKRVVLIGQGKKFEVWSEAIWESRCVQWREEAAQERGDPPPELDSLVL